MREQIVGKLDEFFGDLEGWPKKYELEDLADSIMELLPQWVSVEDWLPEKKKDSLASKVVWIAHKYPGSVGWEYGRGWYNHKLKHWLDSNFNEVDVTHWMSIKPPEAK